jgi:hypothetical protein
MIWLTTIARQMIANRTGTTGKPVARNVGRYPARRRHRMAPSASAPKKIHSVYTTRDTMTP